LLYSKKDKGLQSFFIQSSQADKKIKELRWKNLDALIAYSESFECRHAEILTYYKDVQRITSCGHCDVCDQKSNRKINTPIKNTILIKKKSATSKTIYDEQLSEEESQLFDKLKQWRKAKAKELDVPAFVIFGDKTLREIAKSNPQFRRI
jgi:ATP-dependent DNA helicase RecQ